MEKPDVDSIEGLLARDLDRAEDRGAQPALDRQDGHRDLRLSAAPAVGARGYSALSQPAAGRCNGKAPCRSPTSCSRGRRVRGSRSGRRSCSSARRICPSCSRTCAARGFIRAYVDGELISVASPPSSIDGRDHSISVVVDRLTVKPEDPEPSRRFAGDRAQGGAGGRRSRQRRREDRRAVLRALRLSDVRHLAARARAASISRSTRRSARAPRAADCRTRRRVSEALILGGPRISILEGVNPPVGRAKRVSAQDRAAGARASAQVRSQHAVGPICRNRCATRSSTATSATQTVARARRRRSDGKASSATSSVATTNPIPTPFAWSCRST